MLYLKTYVQCWGYEASMLHNIGRGNCKVNSASRFLIHKCYILRPYSFDGRQLRLSANNQQMRRRIR
jgi:hypothetical protein